MIMGIISLIFFIVGLFLFFYGFKKYKDISYTIGIIMIFIGVIGIFVFIGINEKIIASWFTI